MSSDQIPPESATSPVPTPEEALAPELEVGSRAWVKRDLEFWHRCTVESIGAAGVTVILDNMDELTVPREHVQLIELQRGNLVFFHHGEHTIGGFPALINSVHGEGADIQFPASIYDDRFMRLERRCLLRDLRLYYDLEPIEWKVGTHVFADKRVVAERRRVSGNSEPFVVLYPGSIVKVHNEFCIEVDFIGGRTTVVPITLVEKLDVSAGDMVYACTGHKVSDTWSLPESSKTESDTLLPAPDLRFGETWELCRVVERDGQSLLLQDGAGGRFETNMTLIAILPRGYQMLEGKLQRIPIGTAASVPTEDAPLDHAVHIVRTERWADADNEPITKEHVDALIAADPELEWSARDWVDMKDITGSITRYFAILWKKTPCFWWLGSDIRCAQPSEEQLAKMIDIAIALDANVIGDDGEEYH